MNTTDHTTETDESTKPASTFIVPPEYRFIALVCATLVPLPVAALLEVFFHNEILTGAATVLILIAALLLLSRKATDEEENLADPVSQTRRVVLIALGGIVAGCISYLLLPEPYLWASIFILGMPVGYAAFRYLAIRSEIEDQEEQRLSAQFSRDLRPVTEEQETAFLEAPKRLQEIAKRRERISVLVNAITK